MSLAVAHIDLDAFYVSVELQRRPDLLGLPVIVSGSGPRSVVTTASYEARAFGIASGMPTSRARRLYPHAVVIVPDFAAYKAMSQRVMEIVRAHIECVEQRGLDEAYLDVSGHVAPRATLRRLVIDIRQATGLACSVGLGPNRVVAKVASDAEKPRGFVVLSQAEAQARFRDSNPALIPGIGPKSVERLGRLKLTTVEAVAHADLYLLTQAFGPQQAAALQALARFDASATVTPVRDAVSESRERTFDVDLADAAPQETALTDLAHNLCRRLANAGLRGRTISIKVRLDDFSTVTRSRTITTPTCAADVVTPIAIELLRAYAAPRPVRLLGVRVSGFLTETDTDPQLQMTFGADQ